ncbi:MAG: hydantoinase B/oxoprolinase family protein, partial [Sphingomonadaceae bacterium]|nr:hydantoinase B/oxoprolinase family protein [Sphingomonadaceae bacterium]
AVEGIRRLTGGAAASVRIGTTVATNALLERAGEPVVLAITRGHADALRIGHQARPRLFDLDIRPPPPLHARTIEIDERVTAEGEVLRPLDEAAAEAALAAAYAEGFRSVAIVLLHGWRFPAHEARLAAIARGIGFAVAVSHAVSPTIKLVPRGQTTVADAYLSPVLRRYVDRVAGALGDTPLHFMQSNGGLAAADGFRGKDAVLSGPAGGVVGMVAVGRAAGFERLIGFDMGGTSTDVSHFAGTFERAGETVVAGVPLRTPMLSIDTVAAGGGSICRWDGTRLRVGPESAGAVPGPAAYGGGGPLTVTDAQVLLGRLQPAHFPAIFGPGGDAPLDVAAVGAKFAALAAETGLTAEALAEGCLDIAVATMARAIRAISIERGHDLSGYTLVAMGGAAGQCACRVAAALGIARVLVSPFAGVLSALGIAQAAVRAVREASVNACIREEVTEIVTTLRTEAEAEVRAADEVTAVTTTATALIRAGSDTALEVPFGSPEAMAGAFATAHRTRFGFDAPGALVIDAVRVEAIGEVAGIDGLAAAVATAAPPAMVEMAGETVPLYARAGLADAPLAGPAIVVDDGSTTIVERGWTAGRLLTGDLLLTATAAPPARTATATATVSDPVALELFNHRLMGLAEAMGVALQSTAASVNIKERLDFSCALFDGEGALVANAPHIPVHLGSMGESVAAVLRARGDTLADGDAVMLNAPYNGGTHLPDITVIMPVFVEGERRFFVAARGHHADIGGITPGSMPAGSRTIAEEGVLIDDVLLVAGGRFLEAETRALLASGRWPARDPDRNIGDLKAQVAACVRGADGLRALCAEHGTATVAAYMAHVQANAEAAVRQAIRRLDGGHFAYALDDGAVVRVAVVVDRADGTATVDFTGTSGQQVSNFNAPRSVVRAAVLYAFRCLIADDIPLNDGCMRAIRLLIPPGSMLDPVPPAAVVAGNVEVSQVVTDAVFGALGVVAAAQGTMNNLTFGASDWQYYETIAGGAGAGTGFAGASAVQTHMTNSRLTDPEVFESRFPVLVEDFAVRAGSGGEGQWRGGDGVVRRLRFRSDATVSILSNRRRVPPFGLAGGSDGAAGANHVERAGGHVEPVGARATVELAAGDAFVVATPGGGGYGLRP